MLIGDTMLERVLPAVVIILAGAGYLVAVRLIWRHHTRTALRPLRLAAFVAGLVSCAGALEWPMDALADERFSWHMAQHVLLVLVAAPLLALGTPITVAVLATPRVVRRRWLTPGLRSRVATGLRSPLLSWALFVGVLWVTHLPSVYDAAVEHDAIHATEHFAYLLTAFAFWSAVVGLEAGPHPLSYPARELYLFLSMAAMAVLGLALSGADRASYPYYVRIDRAAGISALADQHTGGVVMWLAGTFTVVPAMALVLLAWLAEDERRTRHEEERAERVAGTASARSADHVRQPEADLIRQAQAGRYPQ